MIFVVSTALFQVNYLNKALASFSASIVTPLNFVFFSFATLLTTSVLYKGFNLSSPVVGLTLSMGFLVIVIGVSLLFQYNLKVNNMKITGYIEDINDIDVEVEINDNPLVMMSKAFPLKPDKKVNASVGSASKIIRRATDIESSEIYVRPDEEELNEKPVEEKIIVNHSIAPVISLSEQIQKRQEMINNTDKTFQIANPVTQPSQAIPQQQTPPSLPSNTSAFSSSSNHVKAGLLHNGPIIGQSIIQVVPATFISNANPPNSVNMQSSSVYPVISQIDSQNRIFPANQPYLNEIQTRLVTHDDSLVNTNSYFNMQQQNEPSQQGSDSALNTKANLRLQDIGISAVKSMYENDYEESISEASTALSSTI
jgi:hypothetical protein